MCAFYDQRLAAPASPAALRSEYEADLREILEGRNVEAAAEETGIDVDRLSSLRAGDSPRLSLEEAAAIQSLPADEPDAETIATMAGEHLLLGMTTAVLDVEALASELEFDLDPTEIQQKIERRAPMSLEEYVHVQYVIADRSP